MLRFMGSQRVRCDCAIEQVTSRVKELELIDRVSEELWTKVCNIVQEVVTITIPKKRNATSQNGCLRRPDKYLRKEEKKKAKEERKDTPI